MSRGQSWNGDRKSFVISIIRPGFSKAIVGYGYSLAHGNRVDFAHDLRFIANCESRWGPIHQDNAPCLLGLHRSPNRRHVRLQRHAERPGNTQQRGQTRVTALAQRTIQRRSRQPRPPSPRPSCRAPARWCQAHARHSRRRRWSGRRSAVLPATPERSASAPRRTVRSSSLFCLRTRRQVLGLGDALPAPLVRERVEPIPENRCLPNFDHV